MCTPTTAHAMPLLRELHWLSVCPWVQPEVLVSIFKPFHGMGLEYLRNCFSLITSAHPIRSGREGMLGAPCARDLHLVGPGRGLFFNTEPALQNILPPKLPWFHLFSYFERAPSYVTMSRCSQNQRLV